VAHGGAWALAWRALASAARALLGAPASVFDWAPGAGAWRPDAPGGSGAAAVSVLAGSASLADLLLWVLLRLQHKLMGSGAYARAMARVELERAAAAASAQKRRRAWYLDQARAALRTSRLRLARTLRIARLKDSLLDADGSGLQLAGAGSTASGLAAAASAALAARERAALLAAGDAAGQFDDGAAPAAVEGAEEGGSDASRPRSGSVRQRRRRGPRGGGAGEPPAHAPASAPGSVGPASRLQRSSSDPGSAPPGARSGSSGALGAEPSEGDELILVDPRLAPLPAPAAGAEGPPTDAPVAPLRSSSAPELAAAGAPPTLKAEPRGAEATVGAPGGWRGAVARALLGQSAGICYAALALAFVADLSLLTLVYPATMLLVPLLAQRTCAIYWRVRGLEPYEPLGQRAACVARTLRPPPRRMLDRPGVEPPHAAQNSPS
jgi:hypothetical protein